MEKVVLGCKRAHRPTEIANNSIVESTEGEYLQSGIDVLEGVCVCIPTIKHIGSTKEYKRDHKTFVNMSKRHAYLTLAHIYWDIITTKILMREGSMLVAPNVENIRDIEVHTLASVNMPKLKNIVGTVIIKRAAYVNMPELEIISGRLIIDEAAFFYAPKLKEVRNVYMKNLEDIQVYSKKSNKDPKKFN